MIKTGTGTVRVELDPDVRKLHTAQSLRRQTYAVARRAVTTFRQSRSQARDRVLSQPPDEP